MADIPILGLYRHSFRSFVRFVFATLHPADAFVDNWHIDVICDRLMRCQDGDIRRLTINLPPRHLKSLIVSIAWPLFLCAHRPGIRVCVCAGSADLAAQFDEQRRRLVSSTRLLQIFPNLRLKDTPRRLRFANGSEIMQTVVLKPQMGRGADVYIIDDPQSAAEAASAKHQDTIAAWYSKEVFRGLNKKARAVVVVVMQRLHPMDFCEMVTAGERWERLVLPAIAKTDEAWSLSDGTVYRRKALDVLSPRQESIETLQDVLRQTGGKDFYAQFLQAPTLYGELRPGRVKGCCRGFGRNCSAAFSPAG